MERIGDTLRETAYTYDRDNRVTTVVSGDSGKQYHYDAYGRVEKQETVTVNQTQWETNLEAWNAAKKQAAESDDPDSVTIPDLDLPGTAVKTDEFTFRDVEIDSKTFQTSQVETHTVDVNGTVNDVTYTYQYDDNGNIISISDGTKTTTYVYDSANQLIRENNQAKNYTQTWTYDNAGNIELTTRYAYTETGDLTNSTVVSSTDYNYDDPDWGDLLTSYETGGTTYTVSYDGIGNPDKIVDASTGSTVKDYTWQQGRQLQKLEQSGRTFTYTYDANGMRTSRSEGAVTCYYVYNGDQLTQMRVVNYEGQANEIVEYIDLSYDANGTPFTLTYTRSGSSLNGTYYYVTNIQGDVIGLTDSQGNMVIGYQYDAYGVPSPKSYQTEKAELLVRVNPLLYRSYVYDLGPKLYYLQSRYYDPELGRFINADDPAYLGADGSLTGYNLFAYCGNNPVMGYDPTGHWDWGLVGKIALTTVVVAACLTGVGAIAAAAATAAAVSVTTAVTTAVVTAGVSTALSAVDGALCAQRSGGDWRNGAMAGAIGGSVGALVSRCSSFYGSSDANLRLNTLGRMASSLTYDLVYDWFERGVVDSQTALTVGVDVVMDASLGTVCYYYSDSISNSIKQAGLNGVVDGVVDYFQTCVYFSPK